jgi:hypothetical protein
VAYDVVCGNADHDAVATGIGADGNPATSSAQLTASTSAPTCSPSAVAHASNGGGPSSGGIIVVIGVAVVIVLGVVAVVMVRRKRLPDDKPAE